ncbi:MAG: hypothetical protein IMZ50_12265 [Candidatus Atribacteria bacterium]|nr:hypothetical protein [Candidatus Atribacteria bacterium]
MITMRLTIRQLFFILLFLGLFLMTLRPIADPDFWWHLRTGQLIVQTHAIPHTDPFSFTNSGKPWVAHEWLSELLMYGLYRLGSYGLLIFVFSLIITGTFLLAYLRSPQESLPYVAGFTLLLGAIATAPTWGARPQMISLFISSLFLYLLDRYRSEGKLQFLIPLPLITLAWVNLHAGYFLGIANMAIYIAGDLIDLLKADLQKTESPDAPTLKSILIQCAVLGVSILVTLANPNGLHILLYPFQTLTSQAMQQFIQEWFSPDFHKMEWQPLAWFILAIIGAGMLGKKPISPTKILLTLFFGYAGLRSMRHVPLFAIVTIPILSEQIGSLVRIRSEVKTPSRLQKWIAPILLVCIVLVVVLRFVQVVQGQSKSEAETFPKAAVDWIAENQPEGNLFNSYGWGGYIIWRLYPQYPVYIDGRADVYGDKFIYAYTDVYRARPGWEQALDTQAVRLVLVEPESGLASALRQSSGWEIVYEDQISEVFDRK